MGNEVVVICAFHIGTELGIATCLGVRRVCGAEVTIRLSGCHIRELVAWLCSRAVSSSLWILGFLRLGLAALCMVGRC